MDGNGTERFETVVIGGGQAGLAMGYYLAKSGRSYVILDAEERVGDAWRKRWDSLLLFTPARWVGLPGGHFPGSGSSFPTKDAMADYLETYADRFSLPVRNGIHVDRLWKEGDRYVIAAGDRRFEADNVVVAVGANRIPTVPAFADQLDPTIVQMHSTAYKGLSQLHEGGVLIVGAGNSGADISMEVVREHPTWLSGKDTGHVPFRIETPVARHVLLRIMRFVGQHVLTLRTPVGRKLRARFATQGGSVPLVRVKPKDIVASGIERVPRVVSVRDGLPVLDDGRVMHVSNVIWCTGFRQDYSWIDLPIAGESGFVRQERGLVASQPGLYFVGLLFQFAVTSDALVGVGRDAAFVAKHLAARARSDRASASAASEEGSSR
jgi:Predicted flavoprotein involved in K+ transport